MPAWPGSLPAYPDPGVRIRPQQGMVRTPVSAGPAKSRRRFSAVSQIMDCTFTFTQPQFVTFKTFFHTTLGEGAEAFTGQDPVDEATKDMRFVEPYAADSLTRSGPAGHWRVTMVLEILP